MPRNIGIIGCGTIGSQIALAIDSGKIPAASIDVLFDSLDGAAKNLASRLKNNKPSAFSDFNEFFSSPSFARTNLIVESASQDAIKRFIKILLQANKDVLIMSVGALSDSSLVSELVQIASKNYRHIYIPSGAIAGIDAIRSVKDLLTSVLLTTSKHPKALAGAPFFKKSPIQLEKITEKTIIFEGPASLAVKEFPANVNVAAVLGLAGIGLDNTMVRIVADPMSSVNQHEVTAKGSFGELNIVVRNMPSPNNPKTSYLAVLSAIECLRMICDDTMRIGS